MNKEPTIDSKEILRELSDEDFSKYLEKYPENIFVKGETLRRKNASYKNRKVMFVGGK